MFWICFIVAVVLVTAVAGWLTRHRSGRRDIGSRINHTRGVSEGRVGMYDRL